jgi:hypothetical protein
MTIGAMPPNHHHALFVFSLGFVTEGGTEMYQMLTLGHLGQVWIGFYYLSLATTILGFYLMYLGVREWKAIHPRKSRSTSRIPWTAIALASGATLSIMSWLTHHLRRLREKYRLVSTLVVIAAGSLLAVCLSQEEEGEKRFRDWRAPWVAVLLFVVGTAASAIVSEIEGGPPSGGSPAAVVWLTGGLVVLLLGNFFFGLRRNVLPYLSPTGKVAAAAAFVWSLGVSVLTGILVGNVILKLLVEFFTLQWGAVVVAFAPVAGAMAPLFVTYFLFLGAYWDAHRQIARSTPVHSAPQISAA